MSLDISVGIDAWVQYVQWRVVHRIGDKIV